jgi:biopolymer transport protein ExbD
MKEHVLGTVQIGHDVASGWIDSLARLVIRRAARRAPSALSERLEEEWSADIMEQPSQMTRMRFALGCYLAASAIDPPVGAVTSSAAGLRTVGNAVAYRPRRQSAFPRNLTASIAGNVICEINTTPLIDVMLVLLITLIVSLPLMTHAVKLDLPQAPPIQPPVRPEVIDLEIDHDGTVVWNGTTLAEPQQLESHFRTEARKSPQPEIHLRADRRVKYDSVAKVLASAQRNRMQKIGFVGTAEFK